MTRSTTFLLLFLAVLATTSLFAQPLRVETLTPTVGLTIGPTTVRLVGDFGFRTAFVNCRTLSSDACPFSVQFGDFPGTVLQVTQVTMTASAPARPDGTHVTVTVRNKDGEVATAPTQFSYRDDAVVSSADYIQYLLPLTTSTVNGGFGSQWNTTFTVTNSGTNAIRAVWDNCGIIALCPPQTFEPGTMETRVAPSGDGEGAFVYVPAAAAGQIGLSLRVRDLSRQAQNFGTAIPIIETQYSSDERPVIHLIDIPTDAKYRATLRIYHPARANGDFPSKVKVRIYAQQTNQLLRDEFVTLPPPESNSEFLLHPPSTRLDLLTDDIRAASPNIRVEVEGRFWHLTMAPPPAAPTWAFVSITNNETQMVTLVTPHG